MRARAVGAALLAALLLPAAGQGGVSEHTIRSGGLERSYRLYAPPGLDRSRPVAVVLAFHGYGQSVAGLVRLTRLDGSARRHRFLAVYPESLGGGWSAGSCCGLAAHRGIDDARFVDDLLADLGRRFRLDRRRLYATGVSNGGIFSYYLACHRAGTFAAIGAVAATMLEPCDPARPVSVLHVHGLADRVLPYQGGAGLASGIVWPPVESGLELWRREDRCRPATSRRFGAATIHSSRCARGTAVRLITVAGQGHGWPRAPIDTTAALWAFFAAHPRSG